MKSTKKVSRGPLVVGIISALIGAWFLIMTVLCLMTYCGSMYSSASYSERRETVDLNGQPDPDAYEKMLNQGVPYKTRYIDLYFGNAGSEVATVEAMDLFHILQRPESLTRQTKIDIPSQATMTPEMWQMMSKERDQVVASMEAQATEQFKTFSLHCVYLNLLFLIFFALMAFLWIARYRHLRTAPTR